jgi:hypothetical protein
MSYDVTSKTNEELSMFYISYADLATHYDEDLDGWGYEPDPNDPNHTLENELRCCATSLTSRAAGYLASKGFLTTDDGVFVSSLEAYLTACTFTTLVAEDYESLENNPMSVWTLLNLSGDDDVDYNGSYLDLILGILTRIMPEDMRSGDPIDDATFRQDAKEYARSLLWKIAHGYEDASIYL